MAQHPVRMLVLGTGGMANNHAEAFAKIEGVTRPANASAQHDHARLGRSDMHQGRKIVQAGQSRFKRWPGRA